MHADADPSVVARTRTSTWKTSPTASLPPFGLCHLLGAVARSKCERIDGTGPATFVICLRDMSLPVAWQEKFAKRLHAKRAIPHALAEITRRGAGMRLTIPTQGSARSMAQFSSAGNRSSSACSTVE
jgi:hypothetical protein